MYLALCNDGKDTLSQGNGVPKISLLKRLSSTVIKAKMKKNKAGVTSKKHVIHVLLKNR